MEAQSTDELMGIFNAAPRETKEDFFLAVLEKDFEKALEILKELERQDKEC
jgi:hypothetical protein